MSAAPDTNETAIIVAVQDAGRAKSRLGAHLDAAARRSLVLAMLDDVLAAIRLVHTGPLIVVSADPAYDPSAHRHGAEVLHDIGEGYNTAVILALTSLAGRVDAALVLPGDLPQLQSSDVAALLEALVTPGVTIVASEDGGTTALGLRPIDVITTAFGLDSAQRHREAAAAAAAPLTELLLDSLRVDVDTLDDLRAVWEEVGPATASVLQLLERELGDCDPAVSAAADA